jgi:subtilisin family serine protease
VKIGDAKGNMPFYTLNAIIEWLSQVSAIESKPVVINFSFGAQAGGHDGNSAMERHLSARFEQNRAGRVLLIAAGNFREYGVHGKTTIGPKSSPGVLAWNSKIPEGQITLYVPRQFNTIFSPPDVRYDPLILNVAGPGGTTAVRTPILGVSRPWRHPVTGEWEIVFTVGPGPGAMNLFSESGRSFAADAYFQAAPLAGSFISSLTTPSRTFSIRRAGEQIAKPGTAASAITVGSYDWNDQFGGQTMIACRLPIIPRQLSCYSNPGYSRAGNVKPEITAPGQVYTASSARLNSGAPAGEPRMLAEGNAYRYFDGTSAATPYAAGVVALGLQKNPRLTVGEIRRLLQQSASSDTFTGAVPNPNWGYGKLDLAAVRKFLTAIPPARALSPSKGRPLQPARPR